MNNELPRERKGFYLGGHIGKRRIWDNGFNMCLRLGYQYPVYYYSWVQDTVDEMNSEDLGLQLFFMLMDYSLAFMEGVDIEISFGYTF